MKLEVLGSSRWRPRASCLLWLPWLLAWAGISSCVKDRTTEQATPVYDVDVAPILERLCVDCHGGGAPQGGWRATSYLEAIACVFGTTESAIMPDDSRAPIMSALDSDTHRGRIEPAERATLEAWVRAGAPAFRGTIHPPGIIDPRSPEWHGKLLRDRRWAPMLDANDADACGRCHDGSPVRPANVSRSAPGATACTSCHQEPQGALACSTCHGDKAHAYPPRDACFFPADSMKGGAHAAHVEPSLLRGAPLSCSTCHPAPGGDVISGVHGNGSVEVTFDAAIVGAEASYDPNSGQCSVSCHDHGGARPQPKWNETTKMKCGDCHGSPPLNHFPGPCTKCHREADETGTTLAAGPLHMNGHVDLGDGSGRCGACHGRGDDPWPTSGAHASHRDPTLTTPVECTTCHTVPPSVLSPMHLDGVVEVALSGRAVERATAASWDGHSCTMVACHGAGLRDPPGVVPVWSDTSGGARACGACHGIPPMQHTASTSCDRSTCHGSEVTRSLAGLAVSATGKTLHVNGVIDVVP